jgi:hypothetical protein
VAERRNGLAGRARDQELGHILKDHLTSFSLLRHRRRPCKRAAVISVVQPGHMPSRFGGADFVHA